MDYNGYVTALSTLTAISPTDTNFLAILPEAINYAESRIVREIEMLTMQSSHLSSGNDDS
jgi:hypothetical protein